MTPDVPVDSQPMRDILDIEGIILSPWPQIISFILWGLLALVLLVGLYFLVRKMGHYFKSHNKDDLLAPYKRALLELDRLEKQNFIGREDWQRYYFFLDEIFRVYLQEQFHLDVLDKTPDELKNNKGLFVNLAGQSELQKVTSFWERGQIYKFARLPASVAEANQDLTFIKSLILSTRKILEVQERQT